MAIDGGEGGEEEVLHAEEVARRVVSLREEARGLLPLPFRIVPAKAIRVSAATAKMALRKAGSTSLASL